MFRKFIVVALLVGGTFTNPPQAVAHQTEVDSQDVHHMKRVWLRWDKMVERRIREQKQQQELRRQEALAVAEATAETSTPPPQPTYTGGVLTAEQVASYARGAGFPESLIDTMVAIAWRESRHNPNATNSSSGACGLWQLYPCPGSHAYDPATNAALAYAKYVGAGYSLSPWGY